MVMDDWNTRLPKIYPWAVPPQTETITIKTGPDQAEFDALKKEVEELKKVLKAAKIYDAATGQPDCEEEEKIALLKQIAELVGVDIKEVLMDA